ncbi:SET and MYND domain-containing protein 4 isoform X3 [Jatropha curcas]|nr:SET and MYND domain-containing protein 4 isoform X3 [Jatropha curcas]
MVRDLTDVEAALCAKNKEKALELKHKANTCYMNGNYNTALACYSQALRVAPADAIDIDKNLIATLYLNRASLLHKIGLLVECVRDCNRALQISPCYAKAWYRRGKVNAALGNYKDAVQDLNVAEYVESSLGGKKQIASERKIILEKNEGTGGRPVHCIERSSGNLNELPQIKLLCVTTQDKGRGMASPCEIPQASLIHMEEPYALIILKSCRETHCHYCLNELPADTVPCISCSIPLYCSQHCQEQAGGETISCFKTKDRISENLPSNLKGYIIEVTSYSDSGPDVECFPEHKHECLGVHWPAVFPPDIVLAGRMLAKSVSQRRGFVESNLLGPLELSHSYSKMNPEGKLELHIYAIVLLYCLQRPFRFELPINGVSLSQTIILVSQIRVNAMAVVRMKSIDSCCPLDQFRKFSHIGDALTSSVDQVHVSVGQAIYRAGSLFNHSCQPNIHAYFLSRTLFVRTTELVATGCPLELSYGPRVGQWDCKDRLKFLEDRYSFRCQCSGCSRLNPSDLVINAFHCVNSNCDGVVLDSCVINTELCKLTSIPRVSKTQGLDLCLQVDGLNDVACFAQELCNSSLHIQPGSCLNCGSLCNLESLHEATRKSWIYIERLQDAVVSKEISTAILSDALRALGTLRSILHIYNKRIAEANDNLAQAFCQLGDFQSAQDHCKVSIKILEMLYGPDDIVIGYELVKLSTIQISLGEPSASDSINRLGAIFLRYYGSHADSNFPYLQMLKRESCNLAK